jgi:hypothetical protein
LGKGVERDSATGEDLSLGSFRPIQSSLPLDTDPLKTRGSLQKERKGLVDKTNEIVMAAILFQLRGKIPGEKRGGPKTKSPSHHLHPFQEEGSIPIGTQGSGDPLFHPPPFFLGHRPKSSGMEIGLRSIDDLQTGVDLGKGQREVRERRDAHWSADLPSCLLGSSSTLPRDLFLQRMKGKGDVGLKEGTLNLDGPHQDILLSKDPGEVLFGEKIFMKRGGVFSLRMPAIFPVTIETETKGESVDFLTHRCLGCGGFFLCLRERKSRNIDQT